MEGEHTPNGFQWKIVTKPASFQLWRALPAGERISTGFVESTVNQVVSRRFCKKQQMQWGKRGTHLLLQTRVKTLNGELGAVFKRWYPDLQVEEVAEAS